MEVPFDPRHIVAVEILVSRSTAWKLLLHRRCQLLQHLIHLFAWKQI